MADRPTPPASKRRGLGRGLDALLSSSAVAASRAGGGAQVEQETGLLDLDPHLIGPNPEQPRRNFAEEGITALAESIRTHGLLHPIVVERRDGGFRLVAGERRLRAALEAGVASIPAIVRPSTESARHALELALVENLQRTELSPLEEAAAYARLADTFGLSHEAIGLRMGRSRSAVSNTVRLLALPAAVQQALADGDITAGHARALLPLPADDQESLARQIATEGLTVRRTEHLVQEHLTASPTTAPTAKRGERRPSPTLSADDAALERGFEQALGTPVHLQRRRRGGRLVIDFHSDEELDGLYTRLGGPAL